MSRAGETEFEAARDAARPLTIDVLKQTLGRSIANLDHPVGLGLMPTDRELQRAAEQLFDRFSDMMALAIKHPADAQHAAEAALKKRIGARAADR